MISPSLRRLQNVMAAIHEESARRVMGDPHDDRFDPIFDSLLDFADELGIDPPSAKCIHWYVMIPGGMRCKKCGKKMGAPAAEAEAA